MTPSPGRLAPSSRPGAAWWRAWWAPVLQLVTLATLVLTSAGVIDHTNRERAADLAAENGAGPRVSFVRAHPRSAAPVAIEITRLGVHSTLVDLHKNPNGTLQVPRDYGRAGWYVGSAHPGDPGPTVIVGHVDSYDGPGVFFHLSRLRRGDVVRILRADRTTALFTVQEVRTVSKRNFPTALVYRGDGRASLRLITCGGSFDRSSGHYLDNTLVLATPYPSRRTQVNTRRQGRVPTVVQRTRRPEV